MRMSAMNDLTDAAAAAAILACEAARQQLEGAPDNPEGRDAPGELEKLYRWYVTQLEDTAAAAAEPEQPAPERPVPERPVPDRPVETAAATAPASIALPADGPADAPKPAVPSAKEARRAFKRRR